MGASGPAKKDPKVEPIEAGAALVQGAKEATSKNSSPQPSPSADDTEDDIADANEEAAKALGKVNQDKVEDDKATADAAAKAKLVAKNDPVQVYRDNAKAALKALEAERHWETPHGTDGEQAAVCIGLALQAIWDLFKAVKNVGVAKYSEHMANKLEQKGLRAPYDKIKELGELKEKSRYLTLKRESLKAQKESLEEDLANKRIRVEGGLFRPLTEADAIKLRKQIEDLDKQISDIDTELTTLNDKIEKMEQDIPKTMKEEAQKQDKAEVADPGKAALDVVPHPHTPLFAAKQLPSSGTGASPVTPLADEAVERTIKPAKPGS